MTNAVLFDVDGTLIDAIEGQRRIWGQWAREFGLDPAVVYEIALRTRPIDTAAAVLPHHDPRAAAARFDELEDIDAAHGKVSAMDGATSLLAALRGRQWALVTSNAERRVVQRFERLGLALPDVIVDNAATSRGKPAPDPYLRGAELLGADPGDCLVIEDSPSGVTAGVAAGMTVWCVNRADPVPGAERWYPTLRDAASDILRFAAG
ncbi:sugar-phosphatase [Agromyces sp. CF514]|uniref:HAD family hydrolase n=1 Tax=Agromyces sp. CF514 TaxID=1881031 RepID=UPI0008E833DC|nr:HAD-IA family hydrolase [Agromyces sp. CF514]SFR79518.1 sugar-phosphatase [Agromyces sp. CF514]